MLRCAECDVNEEFSVEHVPAVLIVDDDPLHLQIYGWVLRSAGFAPVPVLMVSGAVRLPEGQTIDVAILDHRTDNQSRTVNAAELIRDKFPNAPIILLADLYDMPVGIAPYISTFVCKGNPDKLISALNEYIY